MNERLATEPLRMQILTALDVGGLNPLGVMRVGTGYDRDYVTAYAQVERAVWVGGQLARRSDVDIQRASLTGQYRNEVAVEQIVRVVSPRYVEGFGVGDAEASLNALVNAVANAVIGWKHPSARTLFALAGMQDGSLTEAVLAVDLRFSTSVLYAGVPK